jgi:hypothetical protein
MTDYRFSVPMCSEPRSCRRGNASSHPNLGVRSRRVSKYLRIVLWSCSSQIQTVPHIVSQDRRAVPFGALRSDNNGQLMPEPHRELASVKCQISPKRPLRAPIDADATGYTKNGHDYSYCRSLAAWIRNPGRRGVRWISIAQTGYGTAVGHVVKSSSQSKNFASRRARPTIPTTTTVCASRTGSRIYIDYTAVALSRYCRLTNVDAVVSVYSTSR